MMEHLYPTTSSLSTSENNNNKKETFSQNFAFNAKISERNFFEKPSHNDKNNFASIKETNSSVRSKPATGESSSFKKEDHSSMICSPVMQKASTPNILEPLQPLVIHNEASLTQSNATAMRMDINGSKDASIAANTKQNVIDMDARMQRERVRILGSYNNALNNAPRVRDEHQVIH